MMKSNSHRRDKATGRRRVRRNESARYAVDQSPLWGLKSIHRLAELIDVSAEDLEHACMSPSYREFDDPPKADAKPGTTPRHIEEPVEATLRIHYRLLKFFDSISRPDFIHSAMKGRSYISNASAHQHSPGAVVVMDIRKFYENTTYEQVKKFFIRDLGCAVDVAKHLAAVCTVNGHLPTGSCLSPILSYFVHGCMFSEIEHLCIDRGVVMTLYIDDMTFSGIGATKSLMYAVKVAVKRQGLRTHPIKDAALKPGKPAIITGVVRNRESIHLRNKHHDAIVATQDSVADGNLAAMDKLKGQMAAARSVDCHAAGKLDARLHRLMSGTKPAGMLP